MIYLLLSILALVAGPFVFALASRRPAAREGLEGFILITLAGIICLHIAPEAWRIPGAAGSHLPPGVVPGAPGGAGGRGGRHRCPCGAGWHRPAAAGGRVGRGAGRADARCRGDHSPTARWHGDLVGAAAAIRHRGGCNDLCCGDPYHGAWLSGGWRAAGIHRLDAGAFPGVRGRFTGARGPVRRQP